MSLVSGSGIVPESQRPSPDQAREASTFRVHPVWSGENAHGMSF